MGDLLADVSGALELLDALDGLAAPPRRARGRLHHELGLPAASLSVLRAVAGGSRAPELSPRAAAAVVDELRATNLVTGDPATVTERGRIALDRADALAVRVADVVSAVLGRERTTTLVAPLGRLANGLPSD